MNELRAPVPADAGAVARLRSRHAPDPASAEGVRVEWSAPGFDLERDARISDAGYAAVVELDGARTWIELHGEQPHELLVWALDRAPASRLFSGGWGSFAELAARGCSRAILGVDAESLTGAHRLYERAGMHVAARFDVYERTSLAGAASRPAEPASGVVSRPCRHRALRGRITHTVPSGPAPAGTRQERALR